MKVRVTADTNVFISALMFGGLPGAFLELALRRSVSLITSAALLDELDGKLRRKFQVSSLDASAIRAKIESVAEIVEPLTMLHVVKDDPDDNRVLECASEGQAEFVVSGDRHLLKLVSFQSIRIVTVRHFVDDWVVRLSAP